MEKRYITIFAIVLPAVALTAVCTAFLPDSVPMHYDLDGGIDRMGNKLECFLLPFIMLVTGGFIALSARLRKKKKSENNEKMLAASGCVVMGFMLIMQIAVLIKTMSVVGTISFQVDEMKITAIGIGLLLIVLGNIMPKAEKNRFSGIRTSSSMKNKRTWRLSRRLGAYLTIAAGAGCLLCAAFASGNACIITMICVLAAYVVATVAATAIICRNEGKEN